MTVSSAPMELLVRNSTIATHRVVSLSGELDLATVPQLHQALSRALTEAGTALLVVDLDGVYACDDTALGVILGAAGRARETGGDVRVVCSDGSLRQRLARTGFDRAIDVVSTIADLG